MCRGPLPRDDQQVPPGGTPSSLSPNRARDDEEVSDNAVSDSSDIPTAAPEPWDEAPKFQVLNRVANMLLNADLSGRPTRGVHDLLERYQEPGASYVAAANFAHATAEGGRVGGRAVHQHSQAEAVGGYYLASTIHPSGVSVATNYLVQPYVSAAIAMRFGSQVSRTDATFAEILSAIDAVHGALVVSSQRTSAPLASTNLEAIADNAHAGHLVLSSGFHLIETVALEGLSFVAEVRSDGETTHSDFTVGLDRWPSWVSAVRQSVAAYGAIEPGEVVVVPLAGRPLDFPAGSTAEVTSPIFGTVSAKHISGEYDEGFEPLFRNSYTH